MTLVDMANVGIIQVSGSKICHIYCRYRCNVISSYNCIMYSKTLPLKLKFKVLAILKSRRSRFGINPGFWEVPTLPWVRSRVWVGAGLLEGLGQYVPRCTVMQLQYHRKPEAYSMRQGIQVHREGKVMQEFLPVWWPRLSGSPISCIISDIRPIRQG